MRDREITLLTVAAIAMRGNVPAVDESGAGRPPVRQVR
jgi:hypothetical protein